MELAQVRKVLGSYKYGIEIPGSIKFGEFLDYLRNFNGNSSPLCSQIIKDTE
jgi:hypothetical protein